MLHLITAALSVHLLTNLLEIKENSLKRTMHKHELEELRELTDSWMR